jgi:hypothetical protein
VTIPGNLFTTAMAILPHKDIDRAIELVLSLDVPFWPQLPRLNYYEDMYVQASEHFPGMLIDMEKCTLRFSMEKFLKEFEETMAHFDEPEYFDISTTYSAVYHKFLGLDLSNRLAIRGQLEGPISFGLNVLDQDDRPILFDDTVRPFMFEVMAKRINIQLSRLKKQNAHAFMFVDEPGLQFIFSGMSGYNDLSAKKDMDKFFSWVERPRGVHLCGNPDWDFLLGLDLDILSLDVYSNGEIFTTYAPSIRRFLDRGGYLVWGIVPTHTDKLEKENLDSLEERLTWIWDVLEKNGIDRQFLLSRSMLSPATCCLVNQDGEKTVENAYKMLKILSLRLRDKNGNLLMG